MPARDALVLLVLGAAVPAQTYVVDELGGTGSHFTSIAAAVAAVPSGSTLHVRSGRYAPFTVTAKSLRILGQSGATVYQQHSSWIAVTGVTAAQSVVVQGLTIAAGWGFPEQLNCTSCQGPVLIDRVGASNPAYGTISATGCAQLWVRGGSVTAGWRTGTLTSSDVVFEGVSFAAGWVGQALTMTGGTLQAVGCAFQGGIAYPPLLGGAMRLAQGASVRLLAGSTFSSFPTNTFAAIEGVGTVRYDPGVTLPSTPFGATIVAVAEAMPALTTAFAGGTATASLGGANGHFGVIGVALPGPVLAVPGIDDALWLDGGSLFPVAFGVIGANGAPVVAQLPWNGGSVAGVRAMWQALTFAPAGMLHLSNPSLTLLP
jgi:hypothetical protein